MDEPQKLRPGRWADQPTGDDAAEAGSGREIDVAIDELLQAIAEGSQDAFDALYCRLQVPVSRLIRLLMRDVALAEEVTQEVFLAVWLGASRFDPQRGQGDAWVIGIARSRAIDRIRSVQAARQRDRSWAAAVDVPIPPTPDLVGDRLDGRLVHDALWVLTPKQRQSVMLAFFGGHSYQEVAALLEVPLPTIKSRIRDGLQRLREHLESTGRVSAAS
ncbi:RNA polymerase sigma-70 factor (ECF subfamily) [Nakamurella sp. UYEF19]|uniref:sigma-70 family RNA polymerase sigma factor n=1 Tax=Nakamurella sp. UYEF19 TaxID=1756392 RepID=UPI003395587F